VDSENLNGVARSDNCPDADVSSGHHAVSDVSISGQVEDGHQKTCMDLLAAAFVI